MTRAGEASGIWPGMYQVDLGMDAPSPVQPAVGDPASAGGLD